MYDNAVPTDLLNEARELVIRTRYATLASLQRKLRLRHAQACRVIQALEAEGVIGPGQGDQPREVLVPHPFPPQG